MARRVACWLGVLLLVGCNGNGGDGSDGGSDLAPPDGAVDAGEVDAGPDDAAVADGDGTVGDVPDGLAPDGEGPDSTEPDAAGDAGDELPDGGPDADQDATLDGEAPDGEGPDSGDGEGPPSCENGALTGTSWRDLGDVPEATEARRGVVLTLDGEILAGTNAGLWRRSLEPGASWSQSGLDGYDVQALEVVPGGEGAPTLLAGVGTVDSAASLDGAGIFRSTDGGQSWTRAELGEVELYDEVADFAVQDGGAIYANMSGASIARSTDDGQSWSYVTGGPGQICSSCRLALLDGHPDTLYQGCECPLDIAWIGRYDVSDPTAGELGEMERIVEEISNRRINALTGSPHDPQRLYAGVEGALLDVQGASWSWVWGDTEDPEFYTYVRTIWVDPCDPDHLVFGGFENAPPDERLKLHETFDHGGEVVRLDAPASFDFDTVHLTDGARVGPANRDLALLAEYELDGDGAVRVLVRRHEAE